MDGVIPNVQGSFHGLLLDLQRQLGEDLLQRLTEASGKLRIKKVYLCYTCHYVGISYMA